MNKVTILILFFFTLGFNNLFAQTEKENIQKTIDNYITGTSYNNIAQIKKAFYKDADLFLDNKDMSLNVVSISQYAEWFENKVNGEFNGRVGRIISIDVFQNIAAAKAEILLPKHNLKFIDLFILKKIKDEWKIISKTATSEKKTIKSNKILFITSNADFYGNSDIPTGNSFSEIVNAYNEFEKAGYTIDFVSPEGGAVPLAYINTSKKLEKEYLYNPDFMYTLKNTLTPVQIVIKQYKAVYFVGGGSAMFGVADNEQIQKIAMAIYEKNHGIISSVCHGTAGIVNLKTKDGNYLIKGKKVNGYPDSYEKQGAEYYKHFPFKIQETVKKRGGKFKFSERNKPHVEIDGRLITGQNHLSSKAVALKIIESIEKE